MSGLADSRSTRLLAPQALLAEGWRSDVAIEIDPEGRISRLTVAAQPSSKTEIVAGPLLPGMANCHSHAWQRALVGVTEGRMPGQDDFWGWREAMYRSLEKIGPLELAAITAQVYVEMLKAGYTSVAEFHYIHHAVDGRPFDNPAEMSLRILAAARATGICITLLPVLYQYSDFGCQPATAAQTRFLNDQDQFVRLLEILCRAVQDSDELHLGMAPHSLRAVDEKLLRETLDGCARLLPEAPLHIHIAEQLGEVDACLAATGQRPVDWLLDRFDVQNRWCLVHATHMTATETKRLASSGVTVGLCPSTEANLADGIFPAASWVELGGCFGLGSDSQVCVDPVAECRLLEYGQRLWHKKRSVLVDEKNSHPGDFLYTSACRGGARALGIGSGTIEVGQRADFVVLDQSNAVLADKGSAELMDSWIFASQTPAVRDVMVAGTWRVRNFRHDSEEAIKQRFIHTLKRLRSE